jgi:hypothetical protein
MACTSTMLMNTAKLYLDARFMSQIPSNGRTLEEEDYYLEEIQSLTGFPYII